MLDAYKSNPKLIKQPVFKVLDAKAKADSKKIDDAYAKLMKKFKKIKKQIDVFFNLIIFIDIIDIKYYRAQIQIQLQN